MFILTIKACPDPELIGDYTFYFRSIRIGRSLNSNLPIKDTDFARSVLCLKIQPDGILIWEENGGFYYSLGKKISGRKVHRIGESFGLGNTTFEIKTYDPSDLNQDIEKRYHELTENHPFMADLFWSLKQEMLKIERDGEA